MPPSLLQASLVLTHSMISKLQNKRYSQHCATSTRTKLLAWTQLGLKYLKAAVKACTRSFTISSASPYIPVQSPLSGNFTALYLYLKRGINAQSQTIDPSLYWASVPYRKCWKSYKLYNYLCCKISNLQFGFLRNHSSVQQLIHEVTTALDSKAQVDDIYMDFKKAFDKVSHSGLLVKLKSLGVDGNAWKWLREYLSNRKQMVTVNGNHSSIVPVTSGVPQGSMAPCYFWFLLITCQTTLRCTYLLTTRNVRELSTAGRMSISYSRISTKYLIGVTGGRSILTNSKVYKWTSVPLDNLLNLPHTGWIMYKILSDKQRSWTFGSTRPEMGGPLRLYISYKAYKMLGLLKRTFSSTNSIKTKKQLYLSLVRSQLSYGSQLWRPMLLKDILSLEKIQRRATKFILPQTTSPMTTTHVPKHSPTHVPPWAGRCYVFYKLVQISFKQIRYIQECYSCYGDYQVVWQFITKT